MTVAKDHRSSLGGGRQLSKHLKAVAPTLRREWDNDVEVIRLRFTSENFREKGPPVFQLFTIPVFDIGFRLDILEHSLLLLYVDLSDYQIIRSNVRDRGNQITRLPYCSSVSASTLWMSASSFPLSTL